MKECSTKYYDYVISFLKESLKTNAFCWISNIKLSSKESKL